MRTSVVSINTQVLLVKFYQRHKENERLCAHILQHNVRLFGSRPRAICYNFTGERRHFD